MYVPLKKKKKTLKQTYVVRQGLNNRRFRLIYDPENKYAHTRVSSYPLN